MLHSESMKEIAPALVKAWKAMPPAIQDAVNPHFKSHYASLGAVLEAVRTAFIPNDLCLVQSCEQSDDSAVTVTTTALHISGEWVSCPIRIPLEKASANGVGSAISYGKRYGAGAIGALWSEADDDGTAATQYERPAKAEAPRYISPVVPSTYPSPEDKKAMAAAKPTKPVKRGPVPICPTCEGAMWDNRDKKASGEYKPKSPDFTCKDKDCKNAKGFRSSAWEEEDMVTSVVEAGRPMDFDKMPAALEDDGPDSLPF